MAESETRPYKWRSPWVIGGVAGLLMIVVLVLPRLIEDWLGFPNHFPWDYRFVIVPSLWLLPLIGICWADVALQRMIPAKFLVRAAAQIGIGVGVAYWVFWLHFRLYQGTFSEVPFEFFLSPALLALWGMIALWKIGRSRKHHAWTLAAAFPIFVIICWFKMAGLVAESLQQRLTSWWHGVESLTRTGFPFALTCLGIAVAAFALDRRLNYAILHAKRVGWGAGVAAPIFLIFLSTAPRAVPRPLVADAPEPILAFCRDAVGRVVALTRNPGNDYDYTLSEWRQGWRSWQPLEKPQHGIEFITVTRKGAEGTPQNFCEVRWIARQTAWRALLTLRPAHRKMRLPLPLPASLEPSHSDRRLAAPVATQHEARRPILIENGADRRMLDASGPLHLWLQTRLEGVADTGPFMLHQYGDQLFAYLPGPQGLGNLYEFDDSAQTGVQLHTMIPAVQWLPRGVLVARRIRTGDQLHQQLLERDFIARTQTILIDQIVSLPGYVDTTEYCQRLFPLEGETRAFVTISGLYPAGYQHIPSVLAVPSASGDPACGPGKSFVRDRFFNPPSVR